MQHRLPSLLLLASFLFGLLFLSACRRDKEPENLTIARLMVESRNPDYGAMGGDRVRLPVSGTSISVLREPLVNEFEIANVELVKVEMGLALLIQTTERGARDLYRGSVTQMGSRIVLVVNGTAIGAQRIDAAIQGGVFYTFVELPDDSLGELVMNLKESIVYLQSNRP